MSASFGEQDFGLIPLKVATWGPFVLISLEKDCLHQQNRTKETVENEWLGHASEILSTGGIDSSLKHVCRREYTIQCNWKVYCSMLQIFPVIHFLTNLRYLIMPLFLDLFFIVNSFWISLLSMLKVFCDNYLDGGYHVPYAHGGLASGLNLNSYSTHVCTLHDRNF